MIIYTPEQLTEITRRHAMWLHGEEGGEHANLTGANLTGANLYHANLYHADLTGADLTRANLTGANLYHANLYHANLYHADLTGANLTLANLYHANLTGAYLTGANLTGANLTGANLYHADLYHADLTGADLTRADLTRARSYNRTVGNMRNVKSVQADYWSVTYTATHMQIGCQLHALTEWWAFGADEIARMDSHATTWWAVWKPILQTIVAASPAEPTGYEPKEAAQ